MEGKIMTVDNPEPTNDPNLPENESSVPEDVTGEPVSRSIEDTGESPFVNRAAQGYTGGLTTPHDYESEDNHGMGFVNPPPHMQERALTIEEQDRIRQEQNQLAVVPADFGQKPALEGQNIPTTPETAQESTISAEDEANRAENTGSKPNEPDNFAWDVERRPSEMPQSPLLEKRDENATETGV
jgi:hypothetical protein